jgi:hypothetical protein
MTLRDQLWDVLLEVDFRALEKDGYEPQVRGEDVVILAHLHCLPSIIRLFDMLLTQDLSIPARQIMLIPKPYSTIPSAVEEVRKLGISVVRTPDRFEPGHYDEAVSSHLKEGCRKASNVCFDIAKGGRKPRLILVDDGGMLTETWWKLFRSTELEVISVQQTASGVRREPEPSKLAKIDVARSAAKRHFEAKIISEGVLKKIRDLDIIKDVTRIGVAGVGALGSALVRSLVEMDKQVKVYDIKECYSKPGGSNPVSSLGMLLWHSDLIFGCTGRNFLRIGDLGKRRHPRPIHFVSCSSRDTEFLDLLRLGKVNRDKPSDPFSRLRIILNERTHIIENGGFPINFDRYREQENAEEIVLTRALVLAGIFQAMCVKSSQRRENALMLSPGIQRALVLKWLDLTGQKPQKFLDDADGIDNLGWWRHNSFGEEPVNNRVRVRARLNEVETARRSSVVTLAGDGH